ncbi:MAG: hypothetical protein AAGA87_03180 [Pseudomonadota bacterium]
MVRAETLRLREAPWVEGLRALGSGHTRILALMLMLEPGLCILAVALCVNLIGDGLRDRLAELDCAEVLP